MSDVPELDRLLDEHENYRRNMAWNRNEVAAILFTRVTITAILSLAIMALLGSVALAAIPVIWKFTAIALPQPQPRDPFNRYMAK
jgi:hypothetical protein